MSSDDKVSSDTNTNSCGTDIATFSARSPEKSKSERSRQELSDKPSSKTFTSSSSRSTRSTRSPKSRHRSRSRSSSEADHVSPAGRRTLMEITIVKPGKSSSRKSRSRSLSKPQSSRSVIRSRSKDKKKLRTSKPYKAESSAVRKKESKGSAKSLSRKSCSSSRSSSKSKRTHTSTRSSSKSNTKSLSKNSLRSQRKVEAQKKKSKSVRRRKIEDSAKERLRRKSRTKSCFPGRKVTFASEGKKSRKHWDKPKKGKRFAKSASAISTSASRRRSKIRAKIAAKRSSTRTASNKKSAVSSFSKPRSKRSNKNSSTSSRKMNVTLVDTSNTPPRSTLRKSNGPKNDEATDVSSIDVFPGTVSMQRPSGLENVCQIKSSKVLEMNSPFVVYNSSSIEVIPSNRQLLIQTAVLICDHDKTFLDENVEAKPVIDISTEENGKDLEESRVFLTRANGMILIQRTSVVNNYWEKAEKVNTFHFQPLKFNVVRLNGSGKPSGVLQIHMMHGVRAEGGQLSRREAVVVNFGDEAFIQEESESLRKLMSENRAVKIGKEHERGFSFFEETLDREKTISVSREIGISEEIWKAGERVEKIEDIKICCGGQEIPFEKNNMTRGSSTTSVEMTPANIQNFTPKSQTPATIPSSARIQLSPEQMQQLMQMLAKQISPPQVTPVVPSAPKTPSVIPVTPGTHQEQPRKEQPSILNIPTPTVTPILNKVPSTTTAKEIPLGEKVQPILKKSSSKSEIAKKRNKVASLKISKRKVTSISKSMKKSVTGSVKAGVPTSTAKELPAKKNPIVAVPPSAKRKKYALTAEEKQKLLKSWAEPEDPVSYIPSSNPEDSKTTSTTDSQKSTSGKMSKWSERTKSVARKAMSQIKKQKKPKTIGKRGLRRCEELIAAEREEKIWKELEKEPETPPNEKASSTKTATEKSEDKKKPGSANKKKTEESSKMEKETTSKVNDQLKPKEPSTPAVTPSKTPSMLQKETPTAKTTPLKAEAHKETPSKTEAQPKTSKASTESSMSSSVLKYFFSEQSKPPSTEKTKDKEAPKSAPTVSETSKPRYRQPRSLKAKNTSSVSLKSSLSKKTKEKSSRKRVSFKSEEPPKSTETKPAEASTKSTMQSKPEEPKTLSKSDKPISGVKQDSLAKPGATSSKPGSSQKVPVVAKVSSELKPGPVTNPSAGAPLPQKTEAPIKTPSKIETLKPGAIQKTPSKTATEEVKPPNQPQPDTTPTTKSDVKISGKCEGPVISRLNTKPEGRIVVNAPFDNSQVIPLLVSNNGPSNVAWSLKTTRPSHFEATPASGILQPGASIHAFVGFAGFVGGEEPKRSDRLTVLWTDVEEGTTFCRDLFEKDDIVTGKKLLPIEYNE